jgi:hypothetical protein
MVGARQAGNGHRRFALAIDLHQHVAEARQCRPAVGDIHRPTAIDDGLQARQGAAVAVLDQALDHGRRGEHRYAAMRAQQLEDFRRLEAARFRRHVEPAVGDVGQHVEARAVRHRRGMDDGVAGRDGIDIGEIIEDRRHQVALGQRHALGPAGGAAGVEQPGRVGRRPLGRFDRRDEQRVPCRAAGFDRFDQARHGQTGQRGMEVGRGEAQPAAAVAEDVFELLRMQLGIDRHRHQPGMPAGEHRLGIRGAVLHHQADAIAGRQARRQPAGQARDACGEFGIAGDDVGADRQRGALGMAAGGAGKEEGDVHGSSFARGRLGARSIRA